MVASPKADSHSLKSVCQEPSTPKVNDNSDPSSPNLPPKLKSRPIPFLFDNAPEDVGDGGDVRVDRIGNSRFETPVQERVSSPQHLLNLKKETKLFQIVFKGVVSLLRDPSASAAKSGAYVGYGEIIEGTIHGLGKQNYPSGISSDEPKLSYKIRSSAEETDEKDKSLRPSSAASSDEEKVNEMIQVNRVLSGGYAIDASEPRVAAMDKTPKRNNIHIPVTTVRMSPMPLPSYIGSESVDEKSAVHITRRETESGYGYIFSQRSNIPICVPIDFVPKIEEGTFVYTVVASNPVSIRTGPALDAPCTTATLMPGTSHQVCLRMSVADVSFSFLRLTRRRGWIMEKRRSRKYPERLVRVMQETTGTRGAQSCNFSLSSNSPVSLVATPILAARRRHRPPRRRREILADERSHPPIHLNASSSFRQESPNSSFDMNSFGKALKSPSSHVSFLSEDSSLSIAQRRKEGMPDRQSNPSLDASQAGFFLMRVSAPRGLKILDAPHFQVNNLIHGNHTPVSSKMQVKATKELGTTNQSIFQTMTGHHTTVLTSKIGSPAVFDSVLRARKLPRGCVFEASKRMESAGAFGEGEGLIKLSDNSGWAIVPKQEELDTQYKSHSGSLARTKEGEATRAFEEVGNAIIEKKTQPVFMRVYTKGGIAVSCPPASFPIADDETSITSPGSSVAGASAVSAAFGHAPSQDSDVASSVGSSFIDAMFRTPKKKEIDHISLGSSKDGTQLSGKPPLIDKAAVSSVIPCGMYFEVDPWIEPGNSEQGTSCNDFARICGGQGWVPRVVQGKTVVIPIQPPNVRFGSFWFRVSDKEGIKVRKGPSRRAPSIRREDGVYFRFECGEYLRASEVVTFFRDNVENESFAKLYRNRHVRLQCGEDGIRHLSSLTAQSEWVQISSSDNTQLVECLVEPRIERQHRQGWRYNVVLDAKVKVRRGPSFEADPNGIVLLGGESVLVNERVIIPENVTWLRLQDGQGWVHNVGLDGESLMIPHYLKHRRTTGSKQSKSEDGDGDIAYNRIVARLFHNESESVLSNPRKRS